MGLIFARKLSKKILKKIIYTYIFIYNITKSGIAELLNAHKIYNSNFHSMSIHAKSICAVSFIFIFIFIIIISQERDKKNGIKTY